MAVPFYRTEKTPLLGYRRLSDGSRQILNYPGDKHLITVAQNGSGKDVSVVLMNLITGLSSCLVTDPKCEDCELTARWRAEKLGHIVLAFDPFCEVPDYALPGPRARFNPLDLIRWSRSPVADAQMIAAAFIMADGDKPFFWKSARNMLSAFLLFAALDPDYQFPRHLGSVWADLGQSDGPVIPIPANPDDPEEATKKTYPLTSDFVDFVRVMATSTVANGFVAREANRFLGGRSDTIRDIRSTLYSDCGTILDDPEIIECMSSSSPEFGFDLAEKLTNHAALYAETMSDEPSPAEIAELAKLQKAAALACKQAGFGVMQREAVTAYLCLPGRRSETHSRWFRLMLSCALAGIEQAGLRPQNSTRPRTIFHLNEFASQGRNDTILEALPRMRGYGLQFWIYVQDLNQLNLLYKAGWKIFTSNVGVFQTFGGTLDTFTTEEISKMTGIQTIDIETSSENDRDGSKGKNFSQTGRPSKFPHEIAWLNAKRGDELKQLLIFSGVGYTEAERFLYYTEFPEFVEYFEKDRPPPDNLDEEMAALKDTLARLDALAESRAAIPNENAAD